MAAHHWFVQMIKIEDITCKLELLHGELDAELKIQEFMRMLHNSEIGSITK